MPNRTRIQREERKHPVGISMIFQEMAHLAEQTPGNRKQCLGPTQGEWLDGKLLNDARITEDTIHSLKKKKSRIEKYPPQRKCEETCLLAFNFECCEE